MAINPLGSQGPAAAGANGANGAPRRVDLAPLTAGTSDLTEAAASDQLQLSESATAAGSDGTVPTGALSPEQLQQISQKLAAGAYDGAAAADRIAGKLLDLGELTPPA